MMEDWWSGDLRRRGRQFEVAGSVRALCRKFRREFWDAMLYEKEWWRNPNLAGNINAITMLRAVDNLLPVAAELNRILNLPMHKNVCGRW